MPSSAIVQPKSMQTYTVWMQVLAWAHLTCCANSIATQRRRSSDEEPVVREEQQDRHEGCMTMKEASHQGDPCPQLGFNTSQKDEER